MTVQMNSVLQGPVSIPPQEPESVGCWRQTKNSVGQVVSVITRAGGWLLDTIAGLFCGALRIVWPTAADKIEALWGRLTTIYERIKGAIRENNLKNEIETLKQEKRILRGEMNNLALRVERFQVEKEGWKDESGLLTEERNRAREERDGNIYGKAHLTRERDQLSLDKQQLEGRLREVEGQRDEAVEAKNRQKTEHDQALQEVIVIRQQLEQRGRQDELLAELQRIDEAYTQNKQVREEGTQLPMTELELERLIPQYKNNKQAYQRMIQTTLDTLSTEHELRVPLEGILEIFSDEVGHLERISQFMHLRNELDDPVKHILAAVDQYERIL